LDDENDTGEDVHKDHFAVNINDKIKNMCDLYIKQV
jgi:hypothetical protein